MRRLTSVEEQLRGVDAVAVEVFDLATRKKAEQKAGSRREAYEKALRETREIAGPPAAGELVEWIEDQIRTEETFPTSREVRNRGAEICRSMDHSVPADSWLGA